MTRLMRGIHGYGAICGMIFFTLFLSPMVGLMRFEALKDFNLTRFTEVGAAIMIYMIVTPVFVLPRKGWMRFLIAVCAALLVDEVLRWIVGALETELAGKVFNFAFLGLCLCTFNVIAAFTPHIFTSREEEY